MIFPEGLHAQFVGGTDNEIAMLRGLSLLGLFDLFKCKQCEREPKCGFHWPMNRALDL